jgi:hypothetical protein
VGLGPVPPDASICCTKGKVLLVPSLDGDDDTVNEGVKGSMVDYAAEIDALDRLLCEIDQEAHPRTAIGRE